jgi:hypothetical protein
MSKQVCTVETKHNRKLLRLESSPDEDFIVYQVNTTVYPKYGREMVFHGPVMTSNKMPILDVQWQPSP